MVRMDRSRSVNRCAAAITNRSSTFGRISVFIPLPPSSRGSRLAGWGRPLAGSSPLRGGPFRTGDPDGGGDGDPNVGSMEPPHLADPSRRTLVCRAAKEMTGPSTKGMRFAFWEPTPTRQNTRTKITSRPLRAISVPLARRAGAAVGVGDPAAQSVGDLMIGPDCRVFWRISAARALSCPIRALRSVTLVPDCVLLAESDIGTV
jgi:hypothetical protein